MKREIINRVFHIVDQELRHTFPEDYWKRCMYSASATKSLLEKLGNRPIVVSGDFLCFVVSPDSQAARFQGYASDKNNASHLWVECDNTLLDLMPYYLPNDVVNRNPTAPVAPIAWTPLNRVPSALTYNTRAKYAADFEFQGMKGIQEKVNAFSEACKKRMANTRKLKPEFKWVLFDEKSLNMMAQKGDPWAMSLIKYENMPNRPPKPNLGN